MCTAVLLLAALPMHFAWECTGNADEVAPEWPPQISPVWPMKFTMQAVGNASSPVGPVHVKQALNITWYYDYSTDLWREEYKCQGVYPYMTSTGLFNGSQGTFDLHYDTPIEPICVRFNFGFTITRPDAFVNTVDHNVSYAGRECRFGTWVDHFMAYVDPKWGYFESWHDIETNTPFMIAGQSRASPTKVYASNHILNVMPVYKYTDPSTGVKKFVPEHLGDESKWTELFLMKDHQGTCHSLPSMDAKLESLKEEVKHLSDLQRYHILSTRARDLVGAMQRGDADVPSFIA